MYWIFVFLFFSFKVEVVYSNGRRFWLINSVKICLDSFFMSIYEIYMSGRAMKYIVTIIFLFILMPSNALADEKLDIVKRFYSPIFDQVLGDIDVFSTSAFSSEDDKLKKLIPKKIYPKNVFDKEKVKQIAYQTIAGSLTLPRAKKLEVFSSTRLSKVVFEAFNISIKEDKEFTAVTREMLNDHDVKALQSELFSVLTLDDLNEINASMADVGKKMLLASLIFYSQEVKAYYKNKRFGKKDKRLCAYSFKNKNDLLSVPVCLAGHKAKHYESSMNVAALHWQGRFMAGERDVEEAKSIYRTLLKKDKTGEAHYYLGILMKNAPAESDTKEKSFCFLVESGKRGYSRARSTLIDFSASFKAVNCK